MIEELFVFDKDGTLVVPESGNKFVDNPRDQVLREGMYDRLLELHRKGAHVAIATNQGGCAYGKAIETAAEEISYCIRLLPPEMQANVIGLFCPDMNGETCYRVHMVPDDSDIASLHHFLFYDVSHMGHDFRKGFNGAGGGMIELAIKFLKADAKKVLMIGDRDDDQYAAAAAGVAFERV